MKKIIQQEKGVALVLSLMLLLVISAMVAGFMLTIVTEQKLGGNHIQYYEAMNLAECGISEVSARLDLSNINPEAIAEDVPQDANWNALLLNLTNLPETPIGTHSHYYSTLLAGTDDQLNYTISDINSAEARYVLTVKYKTNSDSTAIYYYDYDTGNQRLVNGPPFIPPNKNSFPIWVVRSTGMAGNARRSVEVEYTRRKTVINIAAAVTSDEAIWADGAFSVCGHNHMMATPGGTRVQQGNNGWPCSDGGWELCDRQVTVYAVDSCVTANCVMGTATTGDTNEQPMGGGSETGYPAGYSQNGTFKDLWEVLGFATEEEMRNAYNIINLATTGEVKTKYNEAGNGGFYEYTGDKAKDGVGNNELSVTDFPDSCGGILWVRGPFNAIGSWGGADPGVFKGLVYVDGEFVTSNDFWLLGALLVKGDIANYDRVKNNGGKTGRGMHMRGNADVLFSIEALQHAVQQSNSTASGLKQISWREITINN